MLTKVQTEIMKVFTSSITKKFSIKQISEILNKKYALVHRSIIPLIQSNSLFRDEHELVYLNYKINHAELAYMESLRKQDFFEKNKTFQIFFEECSKALKTDFFISLVFGSSVKEKGRDIDLLFIFPEKELERNEKIIKNISENFTLNLDIQTISTDSAYEMLSKYEEINVLNESLNKHIILYGGENLYRILNNARK